jgi:hypothetical protein
LIVGIETLSLVFDKLSLCFISSKRFRAATFSTAVLKKGRGREITPIKVRLEAVSYQNFFQRQGVKRLLGSIFANLLPQTGEGREKTAQETTRRVRERARFGTRAGKTPRR